MASQLSKKPTRTAQINGQAVVVHERETVLQAALRNGIDFPNSCRVGGCGACKCKLASGQVTELTETGYLLSAEELDAGFILACQSVPRSDIEIEVDLAPQAGVTGRVIAQEKLTHDIVELRLELEQPLHYEPGQFANLSIEGLPGVERSYSFATPVRGDRQVSFFVRKVTDGLFSSLINDHDVVGRTVTLDGPYGDFWLRADDAPILMVAGGSGLAPILAILRDAVARGVERSVTLVFGAREQRDLYALAEIEAIARRWRGEFRFVPVLSSEPRDSQWGGARGLVTEQLPALLDASAHAYLCGPAGMIDSAVEQLSAHGVQRAHIHFDKFTTQADAAAPARAPAQLSDYLKYFLFHFVGILAAAALVLGGAVVTAGLLAVLALYMLGDAYLGEDTDTPEYARPGVLTAQLWMALPLLSLIVFTAVWSMCSSDPFGFGAGISRLIGYDVLAWRDATTWGHHFSAFVLTGLMIGMVGTITAHELTHRTWDPVSMFIGRWLLAFSFDTSFAIEHVYGHHRYVSTVEDPATAPRGRNVYYHILASTFKGNISAWKIERERLRKKKLPTFSIHNAALRGYAMSAVLVASAWALGGLRATAFFIACALWGKALLEIVNYMEHYGMVRNPATPVQPRHSWNTNKRISSWSMFNLTRHSHHHAQGEVPYQDLRPYPNAPVMINGYLTTIIVAMLPPLWHKLMTPKVLAWDRDYASAEERELAALANARSGISEMERSALGDGRNGPIAV
jgi:NAD(P)H-flavin reductase/ferredoxin